MATPATRVELLREQLFDHSVRKHELWLYRVRRELEVAYRRGEVLEPEFHDLMGVLHGHLEDDEHAVRYGRVAVALAPDFKIARHNLAVSLVASGEPEEAIEILEEILRQELASVEDYTSLVAAYADLGRWKSARNALALAMASADLGNVDHLWRLTLASARAGKYERAVEMFGRYLAARAGHAQTEVVDAPLAYVLRALTEYGRLKDVPDVPEVVADAIQRVTLRRSGRTAVPAPSSPLEAQDDEASALLDAWAPARRRATESVMPDGE